MKNYNQILMQHVACNSCKIEGYKQERTLSLNTVEADRMNIMSKLGAKNSVGIIKIATEQELMQ